MCSDGRLKAGVVLEGFLRFLETTQDFPSMMGVLLFSYNVSRGIHSGLNSSVTGFCFDSKLGNVVKTFIYLFFWSPKNCVAASLETLREDLTARTRP